MRKDLTKLFNKLKEVTYYGNYRICYNYRDMEKEPRMNAFKKEWFESKDCLDIGCNAGSLTIELAKKFGCNSMLGLDIDGDLIQIAFRNLRKTARMTTESTLTNFVSEENYLSGIVTFEEGIFLDWSPPEDKCYHTILCLNVSKWIHLNWGDDGLITLFSKIWKHLHPGGIFILEPQPWDSYCSNPGKFNAVRTIYRDIKIYPDTFQEILLDKIGFRKVESITPSVVDTRARFARQILVFWK